ncbi:MAG: hypothetical protein GX078_00040, partial [Clostridiales bacterium]|nr:hypothetical protein [Clostridiales bacterium]
IEENVSRLEDIEENVSRLDADFISYKDNITLKTSKIEKELNDYKATMQQVNINQEPKQKATGYGVISLPPNAAEGQVSVKTFGETRTNLLTQNQSMLNEDITGWQGNYTTISRTTSHFLFGDASLLCIPDSTGYSRGFYASPTYRPSVTSGKEYTLSAFLKKVTGDVIDIILRISWRDSDGAEISSIISPPLTLTESWNRLSMTGVAPVGAVKASISIWTSNEVTPNEQWVADGIMLEQSGELQSFISGGDPKSTISAMRIKSAGKNLFDNGGISHTQIGLTYKTNGNYIEVNGTRGAGMNVANIKKVDFTLLPGTYTLSLRMVGGTIENIGNFEGFYFGINSSTSAHRTTPPAIKNIGEVGKRTFTIVEPLKVTTFDITPGYGTGIGAVFKNILLECQLERNDDATPYEPYTESNMYLPNVEELRSLPNGTKDEIRVNEGKLIKRTKKYILQASDITGFNTSRANVDTISVSITSMTGIVENQEGVSQSVFHIDGFAPSNLASVPDDSKYVGQYIYSRSISGSILALIVEKGKYSSIAEVRADLAGTTLIYQLAEPVEIPVQVSGTLLSYPSGTVYVENVVADAGLYSDGIT